MESEQPVMCVEQTGRSREYDMLSNSTNSNLHDWKPVRQRPGGGLLALVCKQCGKFQITKEKYE